jgi:DNA-binding NarL/FixJ family response regulator
LLVDDHLLFRRGVMALLSGQADLRLAGEAGNYWEAMQFLRGNACDVAIVDISMPGRDGIDLIHSLRRAHPKLRILVLSMHAEDEYATRAIRGGANGFLTKDSTEEELLDAIRRVAKGQTAISHKIAESVVLQLTRKQQSTSSLTDLSRREFNIYRMLANGMRISEISKELNLSIKTVSTYKTRLLQKLGLQNQCDIVRHSLRYDTEHASKDPAESLAQP